MLLLVVMVHDLVMGMVVSVDSGGFVGGSRGLTMVLLVMMLRFTFTSYVLLMTFLVMVLGVLMRCVVSVTRFVLFFHLSLLRMLMLVVLVVDLFAFVGLAVAMRADTSTRPAMRLMVNRLFQVRLLSRWLFVVRLSIVHQRFILAVTVWGSTDAACCYNRFGFLVVWVCRILDDDLPDSPAGLPLRSQLPEDGDVGHGNDGTNDEEVFQDAASTAAKCHC